MCGSENLGGCPRSATGSRNHARLPSLLIRTRIRIGTTSCVNPSGEPSPTLASPPRTSHTWTATTPPHPGSAGPYVPGQQRREHPGHGGVQQDAEHFGAHRPHREGGAGEADRPEHRRAEQDEEQDAHQGERARQFTSRSGGRGRTPRYGYATDSRHTRPTPGVPMSDMTTGHPRVASPLTSWAPGPNPGPIRAG
ncbi:hypothetical protein SCALM49S_07042 [Streptomyces californicus]